MKHNFSTKLQQETQHAIQYFGTYDFRDKGPRQFVELSKLTKEFLSLSIEEMLRVSQELSKDADSSSVLATILIDTSETEKLDLEVLRPVILAAHPLVMQELNFEYLNKHIPK